MVIFRPSNLLIPLMMTKILTQKIDEISRKTRV